MGGCGCIEIPRPAGKDAGFRDDALLHLSGRQSSRRVCRSYFDFSVFLEELSFDELSFEELSLVEFSFVPSDFDFSSFLESLDESFDVAELSSLDESEDVEDDPAEGFLA